MPAPPSPPYIPAKYHGGHQSTITRIVLHGTVSPCEPGGAHAVARYFQHPAYESSAHYVVDPTAEFQCVYDHTIAWHDGTNTNSIGVEMCDPVEGPASRWADGHHQAMLARTAALVGALCDAYGVPKRRISPAQIRAGERGICSHVDMRDAFPGSTSHWDPGPGFPWGQFLTLLGEPSPAAAPTDPRKAEPMILCERLVKGDNYLRLPAMVGSASELYGRAWVSVSGEGGGHLKVCFQKDAASDGPAPGAGPIWQGIYRNASRVWHPLPSGTEYLECWISVKGDDGFVAVEFEPK